MGKSTINGPCSIAMLVYQRVYNHFPMVFLWFSSHFRRPGHLPQLHPCRPRCRGSSGKRSPCGPGADCWTVQKAVICHWLWYYWVIAMVLHMHYMTNISVQLLLLLFFHYYFNGHLRTRFIGGTYHIWLAYFSGLICKGISPQNMAWNMVLTYLHFRILKFPLNMCWFLSPKLL